MSEIFSQSSPEGEVRYYKLGGAMMQQANGLDVVHDELGRIGINIWDAERDLARRAGSDPSDGMLGALGAEIVMLRPLEDYDIDRLRGLGASVVEMSPESSHLHKQYLGRSA